MILAREDSPGDKRLVAYLREIPTIEPKAPYFLGGYCFGGIVAFEIAQQLKKEGEVVALLALLVPSTPGNCEFATPLSQNVSSSSISGGSRAQSWDSFDSDAALFASGVNADVRQRVARLVTDAVTQPHT